MKLPKPNQEKLLEIYMKAIDAYANELHGYYISNNKISELKCQIGFKLSEFYSIITDNNDDKLLLRRLKRNKKQTITYCLELLSIEFDEEIRNLIQSISNKKHTWRIVQDKKLEYSWDFIERVFI